MKVFLDTNIFVRYLVNDDPTKFKQTQKLINDIESGYLRPYTSSIVLIELIYVMTRIYKIHLNQVLEDLDQLMELHNLTIIEKTSFKQALKLCETTKIKITDCLIALQCPKDCAFVTYDKEFRVFKFLNNVTPQKILS